MVETELEEGKQRDERRTPPPFLRQTPGGKEREKKKKLATEKRSWQNGQQNSHQG